MEHYPYLTARARWHVLAGAGLAAMGALFVAVGVRFAVAAVTGDFPAFFAVGGFFVAMGALGARFGSKGVRATHRLRTNRYGVTIEGDEVTSLEFDPWGDRGFTFSLAAVVGGSEHPRKYHTYLMVELEGHKHRWLPTWRLSPADRAMFFARLGIGGASPGRRAMPAEVPAAARPKAPPAGPPAMPAAPVQPVVEAASANPYASTKLLQVAAAALDATQDVLGIRFLETSGREGDGVFRFGHDEDERDAPWIEARMFDAFPMTAHGAASEWRHQFVLGNARDADGRAIYLQLDSEMLQDAGWWWDVTSRSIEPAVLARWRERFAELHTGREPVRPDWTWLLAVEDRPAAS